MITPKAWGFEDEIVNDVYCGKRMFVKEQYRSSIHKHDVKDEVLMVAGGMVFFETGDKPDGLTGMFMKENERIRIKPGTWHRFGAIRDSFLFECSTHHEDKDSIRHTKGGKIGSDEFRSMLVDFVNYENRDILLTADKAKIVAEGLHAAGRTIGMCNGCFDLMHYGHLELLHQARLRCEFLFVAVNADKSVASLKGNSRPYMDELCRMGLVGGCRFVDYVVEADEKTCVNIVRAIKPNVYITTSEYGNAGPEAKETIALGGKVEIIDMVQGYNTTMIARQILSKSK